AQLTQLTLDNLPQLQVIGNESFKNSPLQSLTLTNLSSLKIIGERSFQNATSLTTLDLGNLPALELIGDNAFENAPIETLNLQGDTALKKISYMAFYKNRLTTVDLSNLTSLEIIGSRTFSDGSMPGTANGGGAAITSLNLSNTPSLKIIGSVDGGSLGDDYKKATYYLCGEGCRTFYGARLTSLDLSGCPNLESVGFASFLNSPIEDLDFTGLNRLQYIGMLAFGAYAGTDITIRDLPMLYEIGGLAFSSGRTTSYLTSMTLENLPNLSYISEQQAFKYDAEGNRINDLQGYNTTHFGRPWPVDQTTTAKLSYNKLTSLTLKNLPNLNNIAPYSFYASPLTSLTLQDLGIYAIGYNAFQNAQITSLDLSKGLTNLATIDYQAFRDVSLSRLNVSNLPNLKRIFPEAFLHTAITSLDLSDTTGFIGFPTYTDVSGVVHKSAFGDGTTGSQLGYVLIGGISPANGTDNLYAENYTYQGTSTDSALVPPVRTVVNDADMAFADQTFNNNNYVPVYILGDAQGVRTQDGYAINPINLNVNYIYIGDADDPGPDPGNSVLYPGGVDDPGYITNLTAWRTSQPGSVDNRQLRPSAIVRAQWSADGAVVVKAPQIAGYKLVASNPSPTTVAGMTFPSLSNLADPDYVEPGNEFTFYYEKDTSSQNAVYTLTENGVKTYDEIGNMLETTWQLTNSSNDPNLAIGAGWKVELTYDPLRVQFMGASNLPGTYHYVNDGLAGVVTFYFDGPLPSGQFAPTCFWSLIPGRTEQDRTFPIYASLINPDHTVTTEESTSSASIYHGMAPGTFLAGKPVAEANPITYLRGMYRTPDFTKYARRADQKTQSNPRIPTYKDDDSVVTLSGSWDNDEKRFSNYSGFTMVYTFGIGENRAFKRNVSGITYTDTLPVYTVNSNLLDGTTVNSASGTQVDFIAAFDPSRNEGWVVVEAVDLGADGYYNSPDDGLTYVYDCGPDGAYGTGDDTAYTVVTPEHVDTFDEDGDGDTTEMIPAVLSYYDAGDPLTLRPTKVSYTFDGLCTMTPPTPTLILSFPYAWEDQSFTNSASFTAPVYRPLYGDLQAFTGADSISTLIVGVPPGNFVKEATLPHSTADRENGGDGFVPSSPPVAAGVLDDALGVSHGAIAPEPIAAADGGVIDDYQGWFYDSSADKSQSLEVGVGEQRWTISVTGKDNDGVALAEGSYFKNLSFTDILYDTRLRYKSVSVGDYAPATVTAYDKNGTILFQQTGVRGRLFTDFPVAIRDDIYRVTITDSTTKVMSGETKEVYIYTELRDPTLTWERISNETGMDGAYEEFTLPAGTVIPAGTMLADGSVSTAAITLTEDMLYRRADDYFWNLAEADRTLVTTTVDPVTGQTTLSEYRNHVDSFDSIRIHNLTEGLGISKISSVTKGLPYLAGDAVDYTIKLNTFDGTTEVDCKNVDMELDNVEIIDVLPSCYLYSSFTPSTQFLLAVSDTDGDGVAYTVTYEGDGYTDDAGKKYDIVRIKIDHLDVSVLSTTMTAKDVKGTSVPQSGVLGKVSGTIDPSAGAQTVLNRVYMDYDRIPGVVNVGTSKDANKQSESYTPEAYIANPNEDPNVHGDETIPNPEYNAHDAINYGIVDGYNPFHPSPTPGDPSDDIIVGVESGVTGITKQMVAQKSIRTVTSWRGAWPNGTPTYGQWKTTPQTNPGETAVLEGVNTGGIAAEWAYDFQYRLRVSNNTDASNREDTFEILDTLPQVGDHTIIPDPNGNLAERYSEFADEVVGVRAPAGYTVEFLVSDDPIPGVLTDIGRAVPGNLNEVEPVPDGVIDAADVELFFDNPSWYGYNATWYSGVRSATLSTTGPNAEDYFLLADAGVSIDPTKVRAIRIRGTSNLRLYENNSLNIYIDMHAPDEGEDQGGPSVGARAINDFVWKCNQQNRYLEVPSVFNEVAAFPATVHIKKVADGSNLALAGAKFGIFDTSTDTLLQVKTTNATGDATFTGLMPGNYYIQELEAPAGYELSTDTWNVTVQTKAVAWEYDVSSVPFPIYADANEDGIPDIAGPDGKVGTADDTNTPATQDAVGAVSGSGTPGVWLPGPDGKLDHTHIGTGTAISSDDIFQTATPLKDTSKTSSLRLKKVALSETDLTTTAGALAGVRFGLYKDASCTANSLVSEQVTNSGGFVTWDNLPPGVYYYKELATATGFVYTSPAAVMGPVLIGEGYGDAAYMGGYHESYQVGDVANVPIVLPVSRGAITLEKVDGTAAADPISGVSFTITRDAISLYETALVNANDPQKLKSSTEWRSYSQTGTTDVNGQIQLSGLLTTYGGVVYYVEETVSSGTLQKIRFAVTVYPDRTELVAGSVYYYSGGVWKLPATAGLTEANLAFDHVATNPNATSVTAVNALAPVSILKLGFNITDYTAQAKHPTDLTAADGSVLAGVVFKVYEFDSGAADGRGAYVATATTSAVGQATIDSLQVGKAYLLHEETLPAYYLDGVQRDTLFRLDAQGNVEGYVTVDNAADPRYPGYWTPFVSGKVTVGNTPAPVPAQLKVTKIQTEPQGSGVASSATANPFVTTDGAVGIKFYIEVWDTNTMGWIPYATQPWIITSDGTGGTYDPATGTGSVYPDDRGTLDPSDDGTQTLRKGQAWLGDIKPGRYRITEQSEDDAPINGAYLPQTKSYEFTVNPAQLSAVGQQFTYEFTNTPVTPVMVKGDYVGTYDKNDTYSNRQLTEAYNQLNTAGAHPHEMVRSDGKIDLIAGLSGAVFEMREYSSPNSTAAGGLIGVWTVTSGTDGTFDFSVAVPQVLDGTSTVSPAFAGFNEAHCYSFTEITAPAGYDLNNTVTYYYPTYEKASMYVNGGKWISLENKVPTHKLTVSKYAGDTMESLADTEFALYYPDGTQVFTDENAALYPTFKTDANGVLELPNLSPGTYYLKEVAAPVVGGNTNYYEVKEGYYKIVITGTADQRTGAAPADAHQTDLIAADPDNTIYPNVLTTSGDAYAVVYDARTPDPYTVEISKRLSGNAAARSWLPGTDGILDESHGGGTGDVSADDVLTGADTFYFKMEYSTDGGITWKWYGMDGATATGLPYTHLLGDSDDTGFQDFTDNAGLIVLMADERALIAAGFPQDTLYRITEVDAAGGALSGWYTQITQNGTDVTPAYGAVQDTITGQMAGNEEVEFTNVKSTDFTFGKYAATDGGTEIPLPGTEFTVYRCAVLADGNAANDAGHVHSVFGDNEASGYCWEVYATATADASGNVTVKDLRYYGADLNDDGNPDGDLYILAETGTLPGYSIPLGYWELHVNPYVALPEDQVHSITGKKNGGVLPPAFELGDWDLDSGTPDTYRVQNVRAPLYPLTGGKTHAALFVLAGLLLVGLGFAFMRRRRETAGRVQIRGVLTLLSLALILVAGLGFARGSATVAYADPSTGSITIHDYVGEETGSRSTGETLSPTDTSSFFNDTSSYRPLSDVQFEIVQVIEDGSVASSAALYIDENGIKYVAKTPVVTATAITGADGTATFTGLPLGTYLVRALPSARVMNTQGAFLVRIPTQLDNGDVLYDVAVYPKNEVVAIRKSYSDDPFLRGSWYSGRFTAQVAQCLGDSLDAQLAPDANRLADIEQYGSANIGDVAEWDVASTIPDGVADLAYYTVTDRYRPGLTVLDSADHPIELWAFAADNDAVNYPTLAPLQLKRGVDYLLEVKTLTASDMTLPVQDAASALSAYYDSAATYIYRHDDLDTHTVGSHTAFPYLFGTVSANAYDEPGVTVVQYTLTETGMQRLAAAGGMPGYRILELTVTTRLASDIALVTELHNPAMLTVKAKPVTVGGISPGSLSPLDASNPDPIELMAEHPEIHTGVLKVVKRELGTTTPLADCTVKLVKKTNGSLNSAAQFAADKAAQQAYNLKYYGVSSEYVLTWDGTNYVDWQETTGTDNPATPGVNETGLAEFIGVAYGDDTTSHPFRGYGLLSDNTSSLLDAYSEYWIVEVAAPAGYELAGPWAARVDQYHTREAGPVYIYDPKSTDGGSFWTGDPSRPMFWVEVALAALLIAGLAFIYRRRHTKMRQES
ncbi:MAG: leucine-rich repeat protein, partial [Clostridiales Family XIII bacterium]|nr:leucine-rich repeat protein [Clostridiales Family XIII bacterium]